MASLDSGCTVTCRAWVSPMEVEAVFDSRSVLFYDQLKAATGGQSVDMVLNTITRATFLQSVACLAPFDHFLEIRKTDVYRNMRLGLEQFGQSRSFFVIDAGRLATQKPDLHRQTLNEVRTLLKSGKLVPLPITTYFITQLPTALKALPQSALIGKVAIEMPENTDVYATTSSQLKLRSDQTYLITGSARELDVHLARLLIESGAQCIIAEGSEWHGIQYQRS